MSKRISRTSFYWYQKAGEQGHATAQYNLGVMCANGVGVKADLNQALTWFRMAEKNGFAKATPQIAAIEQQLKANASR